MADTETVQVVPTDKERAVLDALNVTKGRVVRVVSKTTADGSRTRRKITVERYVGKTVATRLVYEQPRLDARAILSCHDKGWLVEVAASGGDGVRESSYEINTEGRLARKARARKLLT